jgi:hypothetical protein
MDHDEYLKEIETFARLGVQLSKEMGVKFKAGEFIFYLLGRLEAAERTAHSLAAIVRERNLAKSEESEIGIVD